jgi:hypothetical protein
MLVCREAIFLSSSVMCMLFIFGGARDLVATETSLGILVVGGLLDF